MPGVPIASAVDTGSGGESPMNKQAASLLSRDVEVPVRGVQIYLRKHLLRIRSTRQLLGFLAFLLCLNLILGLHRVESWYSSGFLMSSAATTFFNTTSFAAISTREEWWSWVDTAVGDLWEAQYFRSHGSLEGAVLPLSFLVVRQLRTHPRLCEKGLEYYAFSTALQKEIDNHCFRIFKPGSASREPFGPGGVWVPNSARAARVRGSTPVGKIASYDTDDFFSTELLYEDPAVVSKLKSMELNGWFDNYTRVIDVQALLFNPALQHFIACDFLLELADTGQFVPTYMLTPFSVKPWSLTTPLGVFVLMLDCCVVLFVAYILWSLIETLRINRRVLHSPVTLFDLIVLGLIVIVLVTAVFRFVLWARVNTLSASFFERHKETVAKDNGGNQDFFMFDWFFRTAELFELSWTLFAASTVFAYLRLFGFLQYTSRLNALSLTLKHASGQLVSMSIIAALICIGYALLGHILYGDQVEAYRTVPSAIGALFVYLLGEREDYTAMVQVHPFATTPYVISFFILCWLVLLNMVMAIITGSFTVVQKGTKDPDWSIGAFVHDTHSALAHVFRIRPPQPRRGREKYSTGPLPVEPTLNLLGALAHRLDGLALEDADAQCITGTELDRIAKGYTAMQKERVLFKTQFEFAGKGAQRQQLRKQLNAMSALSLSVRSTVSEMRQQQHATQRTVETLSNTVNSDLHAIKEGQEAQRDTLQHELRPRIAHIKETQGVVAQATAQNQRTLAEIKHQLEGPAAGGLGAATPPGWKVLALLPGSPSPSVSRRDVFHSPLRSVSPAAVSPTAGGAGYVPLRMQPATPTAGATLSVPSLLVSPPTLIPVPPPQPLPALPLQDHLRPIERPAAALPAPAVPVAVVAGGGSATAPVAVRAAVGGPPTPLRQTPVVRFNSPTPNRTPMRLYSPGSIPTRTRFP